MSLLQTLLWNSDSSSSEEDDSEDEIILCIRKKKVRPSAPPSDSLLAKWDDNTFLNRYRVSKRLAYALAVRLEPMLRPWKTRNDSTTPLQQVLIALEYYACGSFQRCIADTVGVSKSTVSRIIHRVSKGIAMMRPKWLFMPQNVQQLERTAAKFNEIYNFPKVIGVIDSIHIPIKSPGGPEAENYRISQTYTIKVQLICDTDLCINNIVARWPGSSHDNHVFYHSVIRNRLENGEFVGYWLLGDRGYKVKSYLLTPLQEPVTKAEKRYNDTLLKAHEVVKNTYDCWNQRFPAISIKVRMDIKRIQPLIVATAVLHTMCRKLNEPMPDALDYESDLPPDIEESISSGTGNSNDDYNRTTLINSYFNSLT